MLVVSKKSELKQALKNGVTEFEVKGVALQYGAKAAQIIVGKYGDSASNDQVIEGVGSAISGGTILGIAVLATIITVVAIFRKYTMGIEIIKKPDGTMIVRVILKQRD